MGRADEPDADLLKSHGAHAHAPDAGRLLAEATDVCLERGLKFTPLRRRVLELVAAQDKPIKAYDLLAQLREERLGAAPPTVYRALDFLLAQGFIHRLESINAFVGCHHPNERHAVPFFICDVCASAVELCDARVGMLLDEQARQLGFLAAAQSIEVHGVCRNCRVPGRSA